MFQDLDGYNQKQFLTFFVGRFKKHLELSYFAFSKVFVSITFVLFDMSFGYNVIFIILVTVFYWSLYSCGSQHNCYIDRWRQCDCGVYAKTN